MKTLSFSQPFYSTINKPFLNVDSSIWWRSSSEPPLFQLENKQRKKNDDPASKQFPVLKGMRTETG